MAGLFDAAQDRQVMLPVSIVEAPASAGSVVTAKHQSIPVSVPTPSADLGAVRHGVIEIQIADATIRFDGQADLVALRSVCLGRKNFLFLGADSGGERAAAMYALIGSARLNGIDPEAYLRFVFTHIAEYPINRVADLLPWNVADRLTQKSA